MSRTFDMQEEGHGHECIDDGDDWRLYVDTMLNSTIPAPHPVNQSVTNRPGTLIPGNSPPHDDVHAESVHLTPSDPKPTKRPRKEHFCNRCGKGYQYQRSLVRHHTEQPHCDTARQTNKSHHCPYCPNTYGRKEYVDRHIREGHMGHKRRAPPPRKPLPIIDLGPCRDVSPSSKKDDFKIAANHRQEPTGRVIDLTSGYDASAGNDGPGSADSHAYSSRSSCNHRFADGPSSDCWSEPLSGLSYTHGSSGPSHASTDGPRAGSPDSGVGMEPGSVVLEPRPTHPLPEIPNSVWHTDPARALAADGWKGIELSHCKTPTSRALDSASKDVSLKIQVRTMTRLKSSSLRRAGAISTLGKTQAIRPCPLCFKRLGRTTVEILAHLRKHSEEYYGRHWCALCQIGFQRKEDLRMHLKCAEAGHCGFQFPHNRPCLGHHPPELDKTRFCDNEQLKLYFRLQVWEGLQLQVYSDRVAHVEDELHFSSFPRHWSVTGAVRYSLASIDTAFSHETSRSAPAYLMYGDGRLSTIPVRESSRPPSSTGPPPLFRQATSVSQLAPVFEVPRPARYLDLSRVRGVRSDLKRILQSSPVNVTDTKMQVALAVQQRRPLALQKLLHDDICRSDDGSAMVPSTPGTPKAPLHELDLVENITYMSQLQSIFPYACASALGTRYSTELEQAALNGDVRCVQVFLANGVAATGRALGMALQGETRGHKDIVDLLVANFSDTGCGWELRAAAS